jgi:hypothetical protein
MFNRKDLYYVRISESAYWGPGQSTYTQHIFIVEAKDAKQAKKIVRGLANWGMCPQICLQRKLMSAKKAGRKWEPTKTSDVGTKER